MFPCWLPRVITDMWRFFLIAGHTKNICDTLFSAIKTSLKGANIYTYPQLVKWLQLKNPKINFFDVTHKDFFQWDNYFNNFYVKKLKDNTVKPNHCFNVYSKQQHTIFYKHFLYADNEHHQSLLNNQ